MVQTSSNIWVAASDGDLDRVRHLIEVEGFSPNEMDTNRYSPMHAAASYAHLELLDYLISKGGDINLVDGDGDTPLFGVETVSFAEAMIDRGADPLHMNNEGLRADEALEDSDPEIASFLRALPIIQVLTQPFIPIDQIPNENIAPMLDERILNGQILFGSNQFVSAERTTAFLERTQRILQESEEQGVEPDQRLLEEVEMAMREAVDYGRDMAGREGMNGHATEEERKRIRTGAS
ncbi:hypothetical protein TREMEDRAFT_30739 [Tremella mesenterica DSM 1558]|uniref:uncharacterized protein n=1 Tax=Tremella mesenterica (strain ATCC 24925 / CBS 8224 / DSM 1558 / NBRC 9311 / NRRL Y-6157 / RJB 2259-6 / UBC 559-6) TaxID=578456 RepID=UPI0003F49B9F|nr:uncharacterized protein TREMEDRAFT_30739 [Tremella mesenterica DSM 1558]EIW69686.1 hypothetical protein TREMEDRAFT_30739 [Tremella mesenterica DSM 1558]